MDGRIVGDGYDEAKRAAVEAVQWEIAARALTLGVNVILENGFWSRSQQDDFRSRSLKLNSICIQFGSSRRRRTNLSRLFLTADRF